ncbi:MAG: glycosyltransferase 87 family protein [Anaerolineae bacterium]|nr:glycosyltransferase 87 family protein [Anaerolineae bacterium]
MAILRRVRSRLSGHRPFLLILAAFTVFRILAAITLRPGGFLAGHGPDQYYYFDIGRLAGSGYIAFFDFWMEYPPLMPWLAALAYRVSLHFPPVGDPIFWFNLCFRLALLPFTTATLCLVYVCVDRIGGRDEAVRVAGLWALLFAPLFTYLSWFEPLALFFLALALYGLLSERPWLAGVSAGLGFMAKVFPIAMVPVGLFSFRRMRERTLLVGSTLLGATLVALPPLLAAPTYVLAGFEALTARSSWQSVWSLLEGYWSYGVVAPLESRIDPAAAAYAVHPARLPWLPVTLAFAAVYAVAITRRIDWTDRRRVAQFAAFSLTLLILYNKGYSPQWAVYLGTLALIALRPTRGLTYALLLDSFLVAEWPIAFVALDGQKEFLTAIILVRTSVILLLGLDCLSRTLGAPAWRWVRKATLPTALAVTMVGMLVSLGPTWRAFSATRLRQEPLAPLIQTLRENQQRKEAVVIVQPELLERLRPYLPAADIYLFPNIGGVAWAKPGEWLPTVLQSHDRVWLLYDNADEIRRALFADLESWFGSNAALCLETWYGDVRAAHYVLAPFPSECALDARYTDALRLVAATPPDAPLRPGSAFALRLRWDVAGPLPADYAVFAQLLSPEGKLVAQSDVWPRPPTSQWAAGQVTTSHGLILPADLAPGRYTLCIGLYDASGSRLCLPDGSDAVVIGNVAVTPKG